MRRSRRARLAKNSAKLALALKRASTSLDAAFNAAIRAKVEGTKLVLSQTAWEALMSDVPRRKDRKAK